MKYAVAVMGLLLSFALLSFSAGKIRGLKLRGKWD